ncbi:hypothetical protein UFOVP9_50 [uncultured Caudovirales phage]|jgi:hypothetical protein|uniref:Uncharacterized protein n=1 Tax=uncultured Caudovirales phage TaxID=2100421 RepID=A0A6J5KIT2_9CAUD|nr:hypothetical protein UFOVP9_50 [uncultured Caudovirales phage]
MAKMKKGGMGGGYAKMVDRDEVRDGGMMKKGMGCANMPQDINYKAWADVMNGLDMDEDDTITGVDRQIGSDHAKLKSQVKPRKY